MGYFIYNVLLLIALPFILLILLAKPRCRHGLIQRLGWLPVNLQRLDSPILWIHAVSLGEVTAVIPLVQELHHRFPHWSLVVSTVTETGREAVEQRLANVAQHCYCPLDFPWAVNAYVRCLQPIALLIVETELWPNLLKSVARRQVPAILVNGRLSSKSFFRYQHIRGFMSHVLSNISLSLMQSERDAQRIIELGADYETVQSSGNMKFDQVNSDSIFNATSVSRSVLGLNTNEKLFVAGSTHSEEEDQLLSCYKRVCEIVPSLILLLAPRHIERTTQVEAKVLSYGLSCIRKSHIPHNYIPEQNESGPRVILLDTRGELSSLYSLGWIAFVGGTLTPVGGHNLLEPARWGVPVFFGPFTDHCAEVARLLREAGGGVEVLNEQELFEQVTQAYHHASWIHGVGLAAREVLLAHRGVVTKNVESILSLLESHHVESPEIFTRRASSPSL
ncbi:MAG: 3-deoxy-D-manno-octulosonic acid transferase [Nitrospirales bacterium]